MDKWIAFKKKKPKLHQKIIVYIPDTFAKDFMTISFYLGKDAMQGETHWMPAPKVPK